jgi:hypothetical protein
MESSLPEWWTSTEVSIHIEIVLEIVVGFYWRLHWDQWFLCIVVSWRQYKETIDLNANSNRICGWTGHMSVTLFRHGLDGVIYWVSRHFSSFQVSYKLSKYHVSTIELQTSLWDGYHHIVAMTLYRVCVSFIRPPWKVFGSDLANVDSPKKFSAQVNLVNQRRGVRLNLASL